MLNCFIFKYTDIDTLADICTKNKKIKLSFVNYGIYLMYTSKCCWVLMLQQKSRLGGGKKKKNYNQFFSYYFNVIYHASFGVYIMSMMYI